MSQLQEGLPLLAPNYTFKSRKGFQRPMLCCARSLQFAPSDLLRASLSPCVPQKAALWAPCPAVSHLVFTCQELSRVGEAGQLWVVCFSTQGSRFHQAALSTQLSLLGIPLPSSPRPSESSQLFLPPGYCIVAYWVSSTPVFGNMFFTTHKYILIQLLISL